MDFRGEKRQAGMLTACHKRFPRSLPISFIHEVQFVKKKKKSMSDVKWSLSIIVTNFFQSGRRNLSEFSFSTHDTQLHIASALSKMKLTELVQLSAS